MKTLQQAFNQATNDLIKEHNTNSKLNSFLYSNEDCNQLFASIIEKFGGYGDRFNLITRSNQIERELIPYIHDNFHGKTCNIKDRKGNLISGIIEHNKTRIYQDNSINRVTDNTVSFRREFEDETYSAPETIALWVVTMDKHTTHLYPSNEISFKPEYLKVSQGVYRKIQY